MEVDRRGLVRVMKRLDLLAPSSIAPHLDARPVGQQPKRRAEFEVLLLRDEREDVAADAAAAEAVPGLAVGVHSEGRCSFRVERAEAFEAAAGFLELHIAADNLDDV